MGWTPVEHKYQISATESEHLVVVFLPELIHRERLEIIFGRNHLNHCIIKSIEEFIFKILTIHKIPLTAGILIAPSVPLAREIDPFRMTELISHEVEVASIDCGERNETDHLMESHSAIHGEIIVAHHHMPIHLLVDQTEDNRLVAHESLIMAFAIRDGLLIGATVGEFPENRGGVPFLILLLLDHLDPIVGDTHSHSIVETYSSLIEFESQPRHAAHLLCDGDSLGVDLMYKDIGKREIYESVRVLTSVVIIGIASESLPQTMVVIEHRGYAIEAEAVKLILFEPELAVGEEEMKHTVLSIVEAERIPSRMFATLVAIEIEVVGTVKTAETLHFILHGMRMHDIHYHGNPHLMRFINQTLKIVRRAET